MGKHCNKVAKKKRNMCASQATLMILLTTPAAKAPPNVRTGVETPYPHEFKVNEEERSPEVLKKLDESESSRRGQHNTKYFEYPLMTIPWEGGDPGNDRVIGITYGQKPGEYWGLIFSMVVTHRGVDEWNGLVPCRPA